MAKNQNTFEKRRREMEKKRKAEEKRARRKRRKEGGDEPSAPEIGPVEGELPEAAHPQMPLKDIRE